MKLEDLKPNIFQDKVAAKRLIMQHRAKRLTIPTKKSTTKKSTKKVRVYRLPEKRKLLVLTPKEIVLKELLLEKGYTLIDIDNLVRVARKKQGQKK